MTSAWRLLTLLLVFAAATGCGQKGPLFLPGDPSQITPPPAGDEEQDDEDEEGQR